MRPQIALTIGAGVAGFALCVYILSSMTTRHEPVEWQNGDLVFQTAMSFPNKMILDASASPLTNVGIVAVSADNVPTVITTGPHQVEELSTREFTARGDQRAITVYRVRNLTPELAAQVVEAARRQVGKPYDIFFDKTADNIYAGELVRMSFDAIGLMLGQSVKLEKLAKGQPGFESIFVQQWSGLHACTSHSYDQEQCWAYILRQQVVMPAAIAADDHMAMIYSDMPSLQALRPE